MERFEVVLSLDDDMFLIPCMLPAEKPDVDDKLHHVITSENFQQRIERTTNCLTRDYHMEYIPAGFWARLIGDSHLFFVIFFNPLAAMIFLVYTITSYIRKKI